VSEAVKGRLSTPVAIATSSSAPRSSHLPQVRRARSARIDRKGSYEPEEHMKPRFQLVRTAGVLVVLVFLAACGGGGGGGSSSSAEPPSNNWDSMVWDQGNWG